MTAFLDQKLKLEMAKTNIPRIFWAWKPLNANYPLAPREQHAGQGWVSINGGERFAVSSAIFTGVESSARPYARAIPQAVLMTVKKLKDRFKDAVQFYASDYEVRDPDPFLMVTGPGLDYYVIERWDEPGFRS